MARQIRSKKSTISNTIASFRDVAASVPIPADLNEFQAKYFKDVVESREVSSWSAHDINVAKILAKTMCWVDQLHERLDGEGATQTNDRGTVIANPAFAALTQSMTQVQALSRTLGLGASQRGLSGHKADVRNKADQAARGVIERAAADDLLA